MSYFSLLIILEIKLGVYISIYGSGFIGSRFIKRLHETESSVIINVDKLSYASDQTNLDFIKDDENYFFYKKDINAKR